MDGWLVGKRGGSGCGELGSGWIGEAGWDGDGLEGLDGLDGLAMSIWRELSGPVKGKYAPSLSLFFSPPSRNPIPSSNLAAAASIWKLGILVTVDS